MKNKRCITDSQLKAITLPQNKKELIIKDESTPNLIARISPQTKSFIFRAKIDGKMKQYKIGQYSLISLATARQKAIKLKAQITQGIDPTLKELTFNEVAQIWLKHKSKQNLATFKKIQGRLNNHIIPKLGQYLFSINSNVMSDGTLTKAIKRMGFRDDTDFHGLRGLFSTICNEHTQEHGLSAEIIELCLAHADTNQIRNAYNHSERLSEKAELMKWYNDYIDKIREMK